MNSLLSIFIIFCSLVSCKETKRVELDGEYWDSQVHNLSYYIPRDFQLIDLTNEHVFLDYVSTVTNGKLKHRIENDQLRLSVYPETKNFIFFSKEDSTNYTNIYISEIPYLRINDKVVSYFEKYRDDALYHTNRSGDSLKITLVSDNFINTSDYQMVYSNIEITYPQDTLYLRQYITTKFHHTFIVETESTQKFDFYPYLKLIQFKSNTH